MRASLLCVVCLECRPNHAAFRSRHASYPEAVELLVWKVGNGHGSALGAVGALRNTAGPRVVKLLDNLPAIPAGLACFACMAVWVVASILVEWDCVTDVVITNQVPTPSTVMPAEEPCECLIADVATRRRLVGLPVCGCGSARYLSKLIINDLTGSTGET